MIGSYDQSHDGNRSRVGSRSFVYDLLAWFPIGVIVGRIGIALIDALAALGPVSRSGALVVVLCLIVAIALLARDFDPALLASLAFYVLATLLEMAIVLTGRAFVVTGGLLSPWETVGLRSLAATLSLVIVFSPVGRRARRWTRQQFLRIVKLPPGIPRDDA